MNKKYLNNSISFLSIAKRYILLSCIVLFAFILLFWNYFFLNKMITDLNYNDFGKFYYSAKAFSDGKDMYGPSPSTFIPISKEISKHFWNLNPPHFHVLLLPLISLPLNIAFGAWGILSLISLVASYYLIVRETGITITPWRILMTIIGFLGFVGTATVLVTGQVSFLLLLPVTLAWIYARRGEWIKTGICLGLAISLKPFLLIFLPYLFFKRKYSTTATAILVSSLCFAVGLIFFGIDPHLSWLRALSSVDWSWAAMNGSILGWLSRMFSISPYYSPVTEIPGLVFPLWLAAAGVFGSLTLFLSVSDHSSNSIDRSFCFLIIGALLVSPLGWIYYTWLILGPMTALIQSWFLNNRMEKKRVSHKILSARNGLFIFASVEMIWPYPFTLSFQPNGISTVTIGSIYFWTYIAIWCGLAADSLLERKARDFQEILITERSTRVVKRNPILSHENDIPGEITTNQ